MPSKVRYEFTDASGVYHGARALVRLKTYGETYRRQMDAAQGSISKQAAKLVRDLLELGVGGFHMKILRDRRKVLVKRSKYKMSFPVPGRAPERVEPRRRRPVVEPAGYQWAVEAQRAPEQAQPIQNPFDVGLNQGIFGRR